MQTIGNANDELAQEYNFASHMKNIAEIMERLEEIQRKIGPPEFGITENDLKGALLKLFQACCPLSRNLSDDQLWEEHLKIRDLLEDENLPKTGKVAEFMQKRSRENEIENLFEYLSNEGADLSKIRLDLTKEYPILIAQDNIDPMTVFAKVPIKLLMASESFADHPALHNFVFKDPIMSSMQNILLTYGLIVEFYSFEKSKFYHYIKTLPETYDNCPYFNVEDFKMLKGSISFRDSLNTWKSVVRQYAYFHLKIIQNEEIIQNSETEEIMNISKFFCFQDYRWAASTILAKSFNLPSFNGSSNGVFLVPLLDICPHSDTITSFNFETSEQMLEVANGFEIISGDTIKIFYGARTNNQFVLQHGFFYDDNLHEFCLTRIPLKNSASYKDKNKLLVNLGISESNGIPIGSVSEDVWNGDVVPYMRILEADDEELQNLMSYKDDELRQKLTSTEPLSEKNEESAKNSLKMLIKEKISLIIENNENEFKLLADPEITTRAKNIIKLKQKELFTFQTFLNNLESYPLQNKTE